MDRLHRSCRADLAQPLLRYGSFEAKAQGIKMMLRTLTNPPVHN